VSYLAQLLAGNRRGLAGDLTESATAIRAALAGDDDPARRGTLLGLLAQALVRQDCQLPKIDELSSTQPFVAEPSQTNPSRDELSAALVGEVTLLALAIIGAIGAVAAAVAAFDAWNATAKANEASRNMAAIERDRRDSELTSKFGITCPTKRAVSDLAGLHVVLEDGDADYLDEAVITILARRTLIDGHVACPLA
jgi:hypothetical protein